MTTTQDCSIGIVGEATYRTPPTVSRWFEYTDEDLDWAKTIVQGAGLRVGGRVDRSPRRVVPAAQGSGSFTVEATSKGLGQMWNASLGTSNVAGAGIVTNVAGATYQGLYTLGDSPISLAVQKGLVEAGGTVDAYTFSGCMVDSLDLTGNNSGLLMAKFNLDIADLSTAVAYATPSYPTSPNLFHFANAGIYSGTLTEPTATALASAVTQLADIRDWSVTLANNLRGDRFCFGNGGRKVKPTLGKRVISGKLTAEYDTTAWRDAVLNETPMSLVITYTAGALSTGLETWQLVLPEIKFDSELPKTNGIDLITESMSFAALDNLSNAQPIWIVTRGSSATV